MAVFRYRMQSVLNIKMKMEEQAKMEFSLANMRLNEENEKLAQLYARQEGYLEEARKLRETSLNILKLKENQNAQERISEFITDQKLQVKKAEAEVEKARLVLQGYRVERKTHEKLKEKAFEAFRKEENRKESKEVDELTSYVYGRRIVAGNKVETDDRSGE